VHIGATWQILLNHPILGGPNESAAMHPYVKLLDHLFWLLEHLVHAADLRIPL